MNRFTVVEALAQLKSIAGSDISIEGVLSFEFENIALWQSIDAFNKHDYDASVWLEVGCGALKFNERVCEALHGKRVLVEGKLFIPNLKFKSGHGGQWPAEFIARALKSAEC